MPKTTPFALPEGLVEMYATNDRITRYMIQNLDEESWHAEPPGGKGRTIGAVAAHIHNVRGMWLKAAVGEQVEKLEPKTAARAASAVSKDNVWHVRVGVALARASSAEMSENALPEPGFIDAQPGCGCSQQVLALLAWQRSRSANSTKPRKRS